MKLPWTGPKPGAPSRAGLDLSKLDLADLIRDRERVLDHAASNFPAITRVIPVERVVTLGTRKLVVGELRLRDLAEIQAWLEEQDAHPLDGIPPAWADPDPESRPARLAAAWERARAWPVRFGSDRAGALLGSVGGRAYFVALLARRFDRGFGVADALAALADATPAQWAALTRVAYGTTAREEIAAEVAPADHPARPVDWVKALVHACGAEGGPDLAGAGELTLSQWRAVRGGGNVYERTAEFGAISRRVDAILRKEAEVGR